MRKSTVLIFVLLPLLIFSQKNNDKKIASAINILKIHQSSLDKLSPFDEGELEDIIRLNRKVKEQLNEVLQLDSTNHFPKETIPFFTSQSEDKNFAIFSWEENMGGTYRPNINVFYWKYKDAFPNVMTYEREEANFSIIYQIKNSDTDTLYLALGRGVGCITCVFEKALLLKLNTTDFTEVFAYQIDYHLDNDLQGLNYDEATQILSYEYIEQDCEKEEGENCWVRGKFKFDGGTFIEID